MSEAYVECLVKGKGSVVFYLLRYFLYAWCVVGFLSVPWTSFFGILFGFGFAAGGYYLGTFGEVEYEYLYMDKELSVDRILAQSRRKKMASYSMEKVEIVAPINSHRLDSMKNRQVNAKDFSTGSQEQPDKRYVFYYEGSEKVTFSPSEEMLKVMKNANPRKVFTD